MDEEWKCLPGSRQEGKEKNSMRYFTGKPCKRGHRAPRTTSNAQCVVCRNEDGINFRREKAKKDPAYRRIKQDMTNKSVNKLRENSDFKERERAANRDRMREYRKSHEFKEKEKRHYEENKSYYLLKSKNRRYDKRKATPGWSRSDRVLEIFRLCMNLNKHTNTEWHVDHIVPLKGKNVCGLHVENNLRVIHASKNREKSNRLIEDLL